MTPEFDLIGHPQNHVIGHLLWHTVIDWCSFGRICAQIAPANLHILGQMCKKKLVFLYLRYLNRPELKIFISGIDRPDNDSSTYHHTAILLRQSQISPTLNTIV